ncbi:MAG: tetratricopeptide repeat protein [Bryobacteraceae bacterium]
MSCFFSSNLRTVLLSFTLAGIPGTVFSQQTPAAKPGDIDLNAKGPIKEGASPRADAYYHFTLGHMYEEMAGAYGNRSDYVNKAVENYRLALKEDPTATFLVEDIADLYRQSGRLREAVVEAENALKANPNDLNARRVLARIYTQEIGDSQSNHIDEGVLHRAIDQYKQITAQDPKDVDSLIMLGRLLKLTQNTAEAENAFQKALDQDPDNEDAISGLAMIYADGGDPKRASALFEKLTKKSPNPRAFAMLAASYEQMHDYALAANAYRQALQLDPSRVEIKDRLAQDLALSDQLDDALKLYQEIVASNPQDPEPYLRMSQIYRQQKKFDLAQQAGDKAKALDPDNLDVRYNQVLLLEMEGKVPEAIAALKQILDQTAKKNYEQPEKANRAMMLERLGRLYENVEEYDQAVDTFRQLAALDPDVAPRAEAQIIDTYRTAKEYSKAQQESDMAAKKYPNDRTLRSERGELLSDMNKIDAAVAELKKGFDGNRDHDRETWISLAQVYEKARNFPEMSKALDEAAKLTGDKDDKTTIQFMRGVMFERQKKMPEAEAEFRKVLAADPENASALNYLGYMLADQNIRLQEAQGLIQRALDQEPNNGAYLDSLGWVYYRMNRLDDAEHELQRSLQFFSKDPTIHEHLGDVYFKQGKLKDAISQWQTSLAEWNTSTPADREPDEIAKVQKKLEGARVRLAKEQGPRHENQ